MKRPVPLPLTPLPLAALPLAALLLAALLSAACTVSQKLEQVAQHELTDAPLISFDPRTYLCGYTADAPTIDGKIDDVAWAAAPWTTPFLDIQGPQEASPRFGCRAKMLWDEHGFYIAAELPEPHLWATYDRRDSVIYHENDFEVFLDPDGDTHGYMELEINALNTVWDLLLEKPYRDGGPAVDAWDIPGLRTAVHLEGTLNDPSDTDVRWTVEIAIPWDDLRENANKPCPPLPGDQWRVNFSRVQWHIEPAPDGGYRKSVDSKTGKSLPEDNWVWSPQGRVAMHMPEMWGVVEFAAPGEDPRSRTAEVRNEDHARWALRRIYYAQRAFHRRTKTYSESWGPLGL